MTQQPSENVNRLASIRSHIQTEKQVATPVPAVEERRTKVVVAPVDGQATTGVTHVEEENQIERKRHSLYFDTALNVQLDAAYRQVVHDIFPVQIEKYDFLEACVSFCLEHMETIREDLRKPLV